MRWVGPTSRRLGSVLGQDLPVRPREKGIEELKGLEGSGKWGRGRCRAKGWKMNTIVGLE